MNWKEVKAISAAGALSIAMLATCAAQTPTTPSDTTAPAAGKTHAKGMRGMENLNLTDEQKAKIKSIRGKEWSDIKAVKSDTTLSDVQKKDKVRGIRRDAFKQVSGTLTPEQRQQWKDNMKAHREKMKEKKAQQPS
jgi:Spy/CpxP family protein refolding chaperone